jgi:sugar phosphate isomerase/epimerase
MLGIPLGVKIAYEGLSWGRSVNEFTTSWDVVCRADTSNLGIGLDSFHILAAQTPLDALELIDRDKIFLVQLSDFMWHDAPTFEERMATARTFRVFPGEGVQLRGLQRRLPATAAGHRGRAGAPQRHVAQQ